MQIATMKKQTKGAVAAGGAAVLLLGGLGSLAYWNDSTAIGGSTISSGQLSMNKDTGTWTDQNGAINPTSFKFVPGDTLTYTTTVNINATGDNLKAKLYADTTAFTSSGSLASETTKTISAKKSGDASATDITQSGTSLAISPTGGASAYTVVVTLKLPFASATNASQTDTLNLNNISLHLDQVQAPNQS